MWRSVVAVAALVVSAAACVRAPGPRGAASLDADGRALCRAAFVALVQERLERGPFPEPTYIEAGGPCREVLDEIEVALVDAHRFAEQLRRSPAACPGPGCVRPVDGGTLLAVHGPRFLTGEFDCYDRVDRHLSPDPRPPPAPLPEATLELCKVVPEDSMCHPEPPYDGALAVALDVDTSCGPLSEGRCASIFDGDAQTFRLHCKGGRWRILPGLYLAR